MNQQAYFRNSNLDRRGAPLPLVVGWFILLLGCCAAAAWAAVLRPEAAWSTPLFTAAVAGGAVALALAPIAMLLSRRHAIERRDTLRLIEMLQDIHENSALSDSSKRMLYRDRELDLLRMLTEQDIAAGEFNSAMHLVSEMASQFGLLEESEAFRTRIEEARRADVERQIKAGMEQLNRYLSADDWHGALLVATRLKRLYPDAPSVQDLENHVITVRRRHAAGLAHSLDDARSEDRIEDAMRLLKELDRHVDNEEARRLAPVAKAVVTKHREELADRFRSAVEKHNWLEALRIGEEISSEYPNTRMAEEVSGLLEELRNRATESSAPSE